MPSPLTGLLRRGRYNEFVSLGSASSNVRFGSIAACHESNSPTAAFEREAAVQNRFWRSQVLNVCFTRKRSFKPLESRLFEGPLTANSGHSSLVGSLLQCYVHAAGFNRTIQVSVVHSGDHLLYRSRHGVETPLSTAVNRVGAFKRNHITTPVGAFPARRRLCSLDRYDLVGLSVCWGFVGHYGGRI